MPPLEYLADLKLMVPMGHTGDILCAAISADEKYTVTGSSDHSVILWNTKGQEIRTLWQGQADVLAVAFLSVNEAQYVMLGDADGNIHKITLNGFLRQSFQMSLNRQEGEGWIKEMAFSPDGRVLYVKDRLGESYVDVTTAEIVQPARIKPDRQPPAGIPADETLVFSAATAPKLLVSFSPEAVSVWNMEGKKRCTFGKGSAGFSAVETVAFSPAGAKKQLYIKSADKIGRLWDLTEGYPVQSFTGDAVLSPDWQKVLVYNEKEQKSTLKPLKGEALQTFAGRGVAFSPDGKKLLTEVKNGLQLYDSQSGQPLKTIHIGNPEQKFNAVVFSGPSTAEDPYLLTCRGNANTTELWRSNSAEQALDAFQSGEGFLPLPLGSSAFSFAPDGKSFFAPGPSATVQQMDVTDGRVLNKFQGHHEPVTATATVRTQNGGLLMLSGSRDKTAKLWDPTNNVVKNEGELLQQQGFKINSRLEGGEIKTYNGHRNDVTSVAFSAADSTFGEAGQYVLTGSNDYTVKVWNRRAGYEICTLVSIGEKDWVVSTPDGLFDASPGAMNSMYFVVQTDIIELEQLKARYYEPGLLSKLFGLNKDPIRMVHKQTAMELYPDMTATISADKQHLQVHLVPCNMGGIGQLSLFVNDKEVAEDANPMRADSLSIDLTPFAAWYLPNGPSKLRLRAYNKAGWLKSAPLEIEHQLPATARGNGSNTDPAPALGKGKPALHCIIVGTSDYAGAKLDLKYADKDASCFAQALRAAGARLFGDKVNITLLNTDAADKSRQDVSSKAAIMKAFEATAKANSQDILVVYFSGHGVNYGTAENGQFHYLTKDIASENLSDPVIRQNYTISTEELTEWIKKSPALKQVMILDACNAGKVVEDLAAGRKDLSSTQVRAIDRMKDRTGMFILTGAAADKVSYEAGQYGQGLLTYSLLQGMSGLALTPDKRVDVMTLFQYSRDHVPDLAKGIGGIQTPILAFPASGASFDIGIVDETVKIPLAQVKPVFIRNQFQNEETYDDALGLTAALTGIFQEATARGAQADLVFVDVSEYENAYSLKGLYKVSGDVVEVRGRLFKGKTVMGEEYRVSGSKKDVPALAQMVLDKAKERVK